MTPAIMIALGLAISPPPNAPVRFTTDIVPILTKLGCNSGGCHGKATGQNGFKLSLLGFEPLLDYHALVRQARGRRIMLSAPAQSLLLRKATNQTPHGGGRRLEPKSDEYQILHKWIAEGAPPPRSQDPRLERIEVSPRQRVVAPRDQLPLRVTAHYSDGASRDVTRQALYQSNEPEIATVGRVGVTNTHARHGLFAVMVRYGGKLATFHGAVPLPLDEKQVAQIDRRFEQLASRLEGWYAVEKNPSSAIDALLIRQWRRLRIFPSPLAGDEAFIRRASIDICGALPTRQEIETYQTDPRPDKRARLINRLLERPEYASYFALKWADVLQNRGAGYSTNKQRPGTALLVGWIRDSISSNKPYDQFVAEIITASGSQKENPPTIWHRSVRTSTDYVESVAQAFLGVRIQCAQCHHHPFERWSQADYYGLAAVFSRVGRKGGFADAEVPTNEIIYLKEPTPVYHPRTGGLISPRPLGGPDFAVSRYEDPRKRLAQWMRRRDNPYFGRTMANRMWAHFLGRGLIQPVDDARSTNPASNPELLAALAKEFVDHDYDVKHLIRVICNSYAYGLSSTPHETNREDIQIYARFYPRRLSAEVLLDGISQVLQAPTKFSGGPGVFPAGTRAIELPDENVPVHFLDVFGRPARTSACECERIDAPSLGQALELVNSAEIQRKLTAKNGYVASLTKNGRPHAKNVEDIFMRVLARRPSAAEMKTAVDFLESEPDGLEAHRSLIWSLLATNEFLFNH